MNHIFWKNNVQNVIISSKSFSKYTNVLGGGKVGLKTRLSKIVSWLLLLQLTALPVSQSAILM